MPQRSIENPLHPRRHCAADLNPLRAKLGDQDAEKFVGE